MALVPEEQADLADLARFEQRLQELLGLLGALDPSSARVQQLLAQCSVDAAALEGVVARLAAAPAAVRSAGLRGVQRLVQLNALAQRAVKDEQLAVDELLARTRAVRARLETLDQPVLTGESCDVRC